MMEKCTLFTSWTLKKSVLCTPWTEKRAMYILWIHTSRPSPLPPPPGWSQDAASLAGSSQPTVAAAADVSGVRGQAAGAHVVGAVGGDEARVLGEHVGSDALARAVGERQGNVVAEPQRRLRIHLQGARQGAKLGEGGAEGARAAVACARTRPR